MNIENGKLILEEVQCWDCEGKKEVTRFDSCPHDREQVRKFGGKCPCCGAKNKHSHKTVGQHQEVCHICEGKGTRREDLYDIISSDTWAKLLPHFRFTVARAGRGANFNEGYLGIGILYGITDYTDWTAKTDEEAIAAAMKLESFGNRPTQAINFTNDKTLNVCLDIVIVLLRDGWHCHCATKA